MNGSFALGPNALLFGSSLDSDDVNISRTGVKTLRISDESGTALTLLNIVGNATVTGATVKLPGLTTGAATGKTSVCIDVATGQLYASSSGVACAN